MQDSLAVLNPTVPGQGAWLGLAHPHNEPALAVENFLLSAKHSPHRYAPGQIRDDYE